ncbi:MAG: cysteine desulfurase NifS [Kiritimatiellae bacterium]|jgi:cysteine desulfurase|nr:cysteine desulfurase NifS [Kiritimatiellia bacterium]MDD4174077.1 cysteine desulfurase NifS [Kiritimatiellia bacterium]MDD4443186.1 cysteine desulfurase NifS [Kiritimatiellia bacterium]MDX9793031.1 cysteine desulfurase NifS [Kiritimatiellia bacterium]
MQPIYFDNNATTCVAPEVRDAMMPFFNELYGNPSSMHAFGGQVAKHVQCARERVAAFLNAEPSEIIFTSCGTESDNMAIHGTAELLGPQAKVITSRVEHPAVLGPCRRLKDMGHREIELPVDTLGQIDLEALRDALKGGTPAIVSLMWANNETGVVFPLEKIVEIAKEAGAIIHTDAVQVAGKLPIDVKRLPIDMLSISGHKLHAPKGIGVFYLRRGTRLKTFMLGGHQENGRRGGTENVPYIVGLGEAVDLATANMEEERRTLTRLRDKLENGLLATCPDARVNGDRVNRLPNTTNMSFEYIEGEAILYHMSDLGICASTGSACAAGSLEPSHVIRAMGVPFTAVHGSVRFSLSRYNTEAEVDTVLEHMPRIVRKLRDLSPFGKGDALPVNL